MRNRAGPTDFDCLKNIANIEVKLMRQICHNGGDTLLLMGKISLFQVFFILSRLTMKIRAYNSYHSDMLTSRPPLFGRKHPHKK